MNRTFGAMALLVATCLVLAGQPSTVEEDGFDWNKCVLDEQHGWIRCPLCGFKGQPGHGIIEMVNLKKWHCINCHRDFQR